MRFKLSSENYNYVLAHNAHETKAKTSSGGEGRNRFTKCVSNVLFYFRDSAILSMLGVLETPLCPTFCRGLLHRKRDLMKLTESAAF